jgi:hypothetical protein
MKTLVTLLITFFSINSFAQKLAEPEFKIELKEYSYGEWKNLYNMSRTQKVETIETDKTLYRVYTNWLNARNESRPKFNDLIAKYYKAQISLANPKITLKMAKMESPKYHHNAVKYELYCNGKPVRPGNRVFETNSKVDGTKTENQLKILINECYEEYARIWALKFGEPKKKQMKIHYGRVDKEDIAVNEDEIEEIIIKENDRKINYGIGIIGT